MIWTTTSPFPSERFGAEPGRRAGWSPPWRRSTRKGTEYCTALWEVDPGGVKQARRITRSAKGEAGAVFAANGDLYFTSARPDPESPEADPVNALWLLPVRRRRGPRGPVPRRRHRRGPWPPGTPTRWWSRPRSWPAPRTRTTTKNAARRARTTRSRPSCTAATPSATGTRTWVRRSRGCSPSNPGEEKEAGKPTTVDAAPPLKLRNLTPDAGTAAPGRRIGGQPGRRDHLQQLRQAPRQCRFSVPCWSPSTSPPAPGRSCWTRKA